LSHSIPPLWGTLLDANGRNQDRRILPQTGGVRKLDAEQLKRIPLFADASDEELNKVSVFADDREIPEGTVVMEEGGFSNELLAIEDGEAEVTRGGEHVADLGPGDIFGEAGMLDDSMRSATVTAKSRMRVISLRHFEVMRLKKSAPQVYKKIEDLVEQRSKA
jgi:CRP/FNR family transcriptional regulator, cyclic AMP receptor protein